jgi:hypothetical protein
MALQGSLADLPFPDIIQLVSVSGKTGRFVVRREHDHGEIFLRDGQIVDARLDNIVGEEAVYEIAIWQEGEFEFDAGEATDRVTIHKSNTNLLMEAARRIDEWQVLSKKIPSTRCVPEFSENGVTGSVSLTPKEWALIRRIDGSRTIDAIATSAASSPYETSKVLYGLITNGLVQLQPERQSLFAEPLATMGEDELREFTAAVNLRARNLLGQHAAAQELDEPYSKAKEALGSEDGPVAVERFIHSAESAVSTALGAREARTFLSAVEAVIAKRD